MNFIVKDINNKDVDLSIYNNKVLLIFNSAIKCRYTNQYYEFQELYEEINSDKFEILDFPCNQFNSEAPGTSRKIFEYCEDEYYITFKVFKKVNVNGKNADPLFVYLKNSISEDIEEKPLETKKRSSLKEKGKIRWNFTKFLIDKNGNVRYRFSPNFEPSKIKKYILDLIKE